MRSIYYIATVVSTYRNVIDAYYEKTLTSEMIEDAKKILDAVANRESTVQFFDGYYGKDCQYYNGRLELSNQDFLGIVLDYDDDKQLAKIEQRNYFKKGDIVEFFGPNNIGTTYQINEIYDTDNNLIDTVRHPKQIVYLKVDFPLNINDMMRIKI